MSAGAMNEKTPVESTANTTPDPGNRMPFHSRAAFLIQHYLFGPVFGTQLRLAVPDKPPTFREEIPAFLLLGMLLTSALQIHHPAYRLGIIAILAPVLVYAVSPISRLVLEYRAYFSTFGFTLIYSYYASQGRLAFILVSALALLFIFVSHRRTRVFSSSTAFWKQISHDCPDPSIISNYFYQLNREENFAEVDNVVLDMAEEKVKGARTLLINLAVTRMGNASEWDVEGNDKLVAARQLMEEVTTRWPGFADGWRNLATMLYYERKMTAAITAYERAVAIRHNDSASWLGMGTCLQWLGMNAKAADCYRTALGISPHVEQIRIKLMEALILSGQLNEFNQLDALMRDSNTFFVTEENMGYIV